MVSVVVSFKIWFNQCISECMSFASHVVVHIFSRTCYMILVSDALVFR